MNVMRRMWAALAVAMLTAVCAPPAVAQQVSALRATVD